MSTLVIGLLAFLGGLAVALQARVMGNVENKLSVWGSITINFVFGSLIMFSILLVFYIINYWQKKNFNFRNWLELVGELKWWEFSSGIFGIIIVGIVGFSSSRLGILTTLAFFVVGQIFMAIFLDHFGLMGGKIYSLNGYKLLALFFFFISLFFFLKS